jgi:F0F1-type ATP synthase assembly protein I
MAGRWPRRRGKDKGPERKNASSLPEAMRKAAPYLNIGWSFVVPMVLGLLLGRYLDRRLEIAPWGTLACLLLGMAAGFLSFFRVVRMLPGSRDKDGK